jgi:hypothetical protein
MFKKKYVQEPDLTVEKIDAFIMAFNQLIDDVQNETRKLESAAAKLSQSRRELDQSIAKLQAEKRRPAVRDNR